MKSYFCKNCNWLLEFQPMFERIGGNVSQGLLIPSYEYRALMVQCPHCKTPELKPEDQAEIEKIIAEQFGRELVDARFSIKTLPGEIMDECPFCGHSPLDWAHMDPQDYGAKHSAGCSNCGVEFTEILEVVGREVTHPPNPKPTGG